MKPDIVQNSVVVLQDHCRYEAPSTKTPYKQMMLHRCVVLALSACSSVLCFMQPSVLTEEFLLVRFLEVDVLTRM